MIDRTDETELTDSAERAVIPTDRSAELDDQSERGGSRVGQRRQLRRSQLSLFPLALCVIGLGALLLITPDTLLSASPFVIGLGAALIGVALTLRFLLNRREERGIGTLGLTVLFTALGVAGTEALSSTLFSPAQIAAIAIMASGLAVWLTAALSIASARGVAIGTGVLGAALIAIGGLALAVTSDLIDLTGLPIADKLRNGTWLAYWPIAAIVLAILLLPLAVRRRS